MELSEEVLNELMARVQTAPAENSGKLLVAYGKPGVGKTSTFCQSTDGLLLECKDYSSDALKETGDIRPDFPVLKTKDFEDAVSTIRALARQSKYKKIIVDGGSGLADWLDAEVLAGNFEGDPIKFTAWGRGAAVVAIRWRELADAIIELVQSGAWVFLLCHKQTVTEANAQGNDYLMSAPQLSKEKIAPFEKYVDAVLFIDTILAEKSVDNGGRAKVVGGDVRVMYCTLSASYVAKNRLGLPSMITLGNSPQEAYKAFGTAIKAGRKKK